MKIALITNHNNYAGREYFFTFKKSKIVFDAVIIGEYPEHSGIEDKRCGDLWFPPLIDMNSKNIFRFSSLKNHDLIEFLNKKCYDIGIQGGTGILNKEIINKFKLGILNFHPGDLPEYRGCMAPEWQIYENRKVVSTCHFIDEGIDTGAIIAKKALNLDYSSYNKMRAGIYPETAKFAAEIISKIEKDGVVSGIKQDEAKAEYRKVMNSEIYEEVIKKMEN